MRVLHVISGLDPENGGPTTALVGMAEAQVAAGLDVAVLATWQRTSGFANAERMKSRGVNVRLIGQAYGKLSLHPKLRRAVKEEVARADVVHVHALWEQIQHEAMRAAALQGKPHVVTPHGMLSRWSFSKNPLAKLLYLHAKVMPGLRHAAAIHFTADEERRLAARFNLRRPTIIEPCGIDLAEFEQLPPPGTFRGAYPELKDQPIVLFLGRLAPQKGLKRLVAALSLIRQSDAGLDEARIVIAGPDQDGYRAELENDAKRFGVANRLFFTGALAGVDRIAALGDAELFILPSLHENFGIVVIEALAAGTPVLLSKHVNIWPEIVGAAVGGSFGESYAELINALAQWMSDSAMRRRAAAKARDFARAHYDWRLIAGRWAEHYRLLKKPPIRSRKP